MKHKWTMFLVAACALLLAVSCESTYISDGDQYKKCAEQLFKAIANDDPKAFPWVSKSAIDELEGLHPEIKDNILSFVSDLDNKVPALLAKWRKAGENVGIDWQDITVDTVYVNKSLTLDTIQTYYDVEGGNIVVHSKGKRFRIRFDQALRTSAIDIAWRTIVLYNFAPLEPSPDYTPPYQLVQDKDFDTFYKSLAMCYKTESLSEINKIFLINDHGKKVFNPSESEGDVPWEERHLFGEFSDVLREEFVQCIKEGGCEVIPFSDSYTLDLSMADRFGLDKEAFQRSEFKEVITNYSKAKPVTVDLMGSSMELIGTPGQFVGGQFMKYKGKWYYVGDDFWVFKNP